MMAEEPFPLLIHLIGGKGGHNFEFAGKEDGAMLKKIWVWVGGWQVKCVKAWLTNGRSAQFGQPEGSHSEFEFQPGEIFSSLSLWGNGNGTRLGAIKFRTSKKRDFFVHMTSWGLKTEYPMDVGSGICLGLLGKASVDIDCMGFFFLNSVKRSELIDVIYPTLHSELPNIQIEEIKSTRYNNFGSVEQSYSVKTSKTTITKSSWSMEKGIQSALSITVKASIPELANFEVNNTLTVSRKGTHSLENSESKTETLSFDVKVPPGKTVSIQVNIGRLVVDLPYWGIVQVELLNGSTYTIPIQGIYKGVSYTNAIVDTKETMLTA